MINKFKKKIFNYGVKIIKPIFEESLRKEGEGQQIEFQKIKDALIEIRLEQYKLAGKLVPIEEMGG